MDEQKNKPRTILVLLILGSVIALISTWHSPEDQSEHNQG